MNLDKIGNGIWLKTRDMGILPPPSPLQDFLRDWSQNTANSEF